MYWHWKTPGREILEKANASKVYISSANAISEDGEILSIDGKGNRLAGQVFGEKKLYIVAGTNKICPDFESALYRARNIAAIENGKRELNEIIDDISGPVSILVIENHRFIVHCVSEFSKSYPQVSFKISHVYNTEQTYDLCISSENHFGTMDEAIPLISEKIILAVHEDHPLASSESISIRNLKNEKFITTGMHSALYNLTRQSCLDAGFEPNISIMCDDPYFVRKYISNNLGLALAPSVTWAGRFRENTKVIPITDPEIITTSYLLFDKHRYLSPAVKKCREFCCEESLKIEGNLLLGN